MVWTREFTECGTKTVAARPGKVRRDQLSTLLVLSRVRDAASLLDLLQARPAFFLNAGDLR
jgi:hypothetical protein